MNSITNEFSHLKDTLKFLLINDVNIIHSIVDDYNMKSQGKTIKKS